MDYTLIDRMGFNDLVKCLDHVMDHIERIEDEIPKGADDRRLDVLYLTANKIIVRMNSLVEQGNVPSSEHLAEWNRLMPKYERDYEKYTDTFLDDDIVLDSSE